MRFPPWTIEVVRSGSIRAQSTTAYALTPQFVKRFTAITVLLASSALRGVNCLHETGPADRQLLFLAGREPLSTARVDDRAVQALARRADSK
jgi:hypothetical protein